MEGTIVIGWLAICLAVAFLANRYQRSGLGWFLLSILISPLICAIIILALGPKFIAPPAPQK